MAVPPDESPHVIGIRGKKQLQLNAPQRGLPTASNDVRSTAAQEDVTLQSRMWQRPTNYSKRLKKTKKNCIKSGHYLFSFDVF